MHTTSLNPETFPTNNLFWFLGEQKADDESLADDDLISYLNTYLPQIVALAPWLTPADALNKETLDGWLQSLSQQND